MSDPQLSIVIPAYNNWWLTRRCLIALERLRAASSVSFETIVVDNASTDQTGESINTFPWVQYVRQDVNINFSGASNVGIARANAPLVLLLNNDAFPVDDPLPSLVRTFEDPRVAIAGGCVLFEDGVVQAANLVVLPTGGWWASYRNLPADLPEVQRARDVEAVNGAAMVIDRAWFESAGGFDEGYINGSEDVDLFMRARQAGRVLRYVPEAVFIHYESASPNRYDYDERNAKRFFGRWQTEMATLPRIERGEISAIAIRENEVNAKTPALRFALEALVDGLKQFGHPIVRGNIRPWSLLDRRFRQSATLDWFTGTAESASPTVRVSADTGGLARIQTFGVEHLSVPWLPCALPDAAERSAFFSGGEDSTTIAVGIVNTVVSLPRLRDDVASLGMTALPETAALPQMPDLPGRAVESIELQDVLDLSQGRHHVDVAILPGLTDACAYGNLALAHAGVPVVVLDGDGVRNIYSDDTAFICTSETLQETIAYAIAHPEERRRKAACMHADAQRRFSVRRAAMRLTDLARVARNGLEKRWR